MKAKNKIALVTGGSRGLGKNMAIALADDGVDIIFTYYNEVEEAQSVVAELVEKGQSSQTLQLDLVQFNLLDEFVQKFRTILKEEWGVETFDFLIHNGGIGASISIEDCTEEKFDQLLYIHYKSVYFLTQKLIPAVNDGGCIVFITSATTHYCIPGYSLYSSLKSALEMLTKHVAQEYGNRGIRSVAVAPGAIATDFNNAKARYDEEVQQKLANMIALGRVGQPDDIGQVVAFLCSDAAQWINGERIEISGGAGFVEEKKYEKYN